MPNDSIISGGGIVLNWREIERSSGPGEPTVTYMNKDTVVVYFAQHVAVALLF